MRTPASDWMTLLQPPPQFLHRLKSVDGSKSLHVRYICLASQRRSLNTRSLVDTFFRTMHSWPWLYRRKCIGREFTWNVGRVNTRSNKRETSHKEKMELFFSPYDWCIHAIDDQHWTHQQVDRYFSKSEGESNSLDSILQEDLHSSMPYLLTLIRALHHEQYAEKSPPRNRRKRGIEIRREKSIEMEWWIEEYSTEEEKSNSEAIGSLQMYYFSTSLLRMSVFRKQNQWYVNPPPY